MAAPSAHPWFSGKVAYLLVYRARFDGKRDRWALCSDKVEPGELLDDVSVKEMFGAGRYRVEARDSQSRTLGAPHFVDFEDDRGVVPGSEEAWELAQQPQQPAGPSPFEIMLKMQQDQIAAVQRDRSADMAFFSGVVEKLTGAAAGAGRGESDQFAAFLREEKARLEREVSELRKGLDDQREATHRLQLRKPDADSWFGDLAREVGPQLMELFMRPRGRGGPDVERSAGQVDGGENAVSLPTGAEMASFLRGGGALTVADLRRFHALYRVGALPDDLARVLLPLWPGADGASSGEAGGHGGGGDGGGGGGGGAGGEPPQGYGGGDGGGGPAVGPGPALSQ